MFRSSLKKGLFLPKLHFAAWAIMLAALCFGPSRVAAAILVEIPDLPVGSKGDSTLLGWVNMIQASSLNFGVEHPVSDSGGKTGTGIDLGMAELGAVEINKSLDVSSTRLFQWSVAGTRIGTVIFHFVETAQDKSLEYLQIKLDGAYIKNWSTSGDEDSRPTEEVAFVYEKIAWQYASINKDGATYTPGFVGSWDRLANKPWTEHNITMRNK